MAWGLPLAAAVVALTVVGMTSAPLSNFRPLNSAPSGLHASAMASTPQPQLSLAASSTPTAICPFSGVGCPAGNGVARVTLSAAANSATIAWPDVQVLFVIETTPLDGVYDPSWWIWAKANSAYNCPTGGVPSGMPCEESNGVPFFVANAGLIASSIASTNPHSHVTFGMVDYFSTWDQWNWDPGYEYHVDVGGFVPAAYFGDAVRATFQANVLSGSYYIPYVGWADNFLHSSSITALYGALMGEGLQWTNNTHHVIIWMGSAAPRDPNYPENYCVSPSFIVLSGYYQGCYSSSCEPSYSFSDLQSPQCEGWVKSQDGNAADSIAALAHTSAPCRTGIGGSCTIDTINLIDSSTDFLSGDWKTGTTIKGGGVGGSLVQADVAHVLQAGCDLASATGGSWNGPNWFTCPNGDQGGLAYVQHGTYDKPNTNNPSLFAAFRTVSFGPVLRTQVAKGGAQPIFEFVPFGNIAPAAGTALQPAVSCMHGFVALPACQLIPTVVQSGGRAILSWNWSTIPALNVMGDGDLWTASFNVVANGPPYTVVPIDACISPACLLGGSQGIGGMYTWVRYIPQNNGSLVTQSFPLAVVNVQPPTPPAPGLSPPPPPPPPVIVPVPVTITQPILQAVGLTSSVGIGSVSLQGLAAGLLAAGFVRVGMKNRPIAMAIAAKSGAFKSKFEAATAAESQASVARFE